MEVKSIFSPFTTITATIKIIIKTKINQNRITGETKSAAHSCI